MMKAQTFIGLMAACVVVGTHGVAFANPEIIRKAPIVVRAHESEDLFSVRAPYVRSRLPYMGTVTTLSGLFPGIIAVAYDSGTGGMIVSQGPVISKVSKGGRATILAQLSSNANGVVFGHSARLIYASQGCSIVSVSSTTGAVTPFVGGTCGTNDGVGAGAQFRQAAGMAFDPADQVIYVSDLDRIRAVTLAGVVTTVSAPGSIGVNCSGYGNSGANGLAVDTDNGDIYIADTCDDEIRQFVPSTGAVTVVAGQCLPGGPPPDCMNFYRDGIGLAALFALPSYITFDPQDHDLYISDVGNNVIRRMSLTAGGTFTTLAGSGHEEYRDGVGASAGLWSPLGIVTRPDGSLFLADAGNHVIRQIYAQGPTPPPPTHGIVLYDLPVIGDAPAALVASPDGSLWYSVQNVNKLGQIQPNGKFVEFALPAGVIPQNLAFDAAGNIWFVNGSSIGFFTPSNGTTTVYPIPSGNAALDLTLGSDGNMWYVTGNTASIGRVTPAGGIIEYASDPDQAVATGYDGDVWTLGTIRSQGPTGYIDQDSTKGRVLKRYVYPNMVSGPIARGPQARMWIGQPAAIGEVLTHNILLFQLPPAPPSPNNTSDWDPFGLIEGPDLALWFTGNAPGYVCRMTSQGAFHAYEIPAPRSAPMNIVVAANGTLWFTDPGALKIGRWF